MNVLTKKLLVGTFSWKRVFRSLLLMYGVLSVAALFLSDFVLFQPQPSTYEDLSSSIQITHDNDTIIGRYYRNPTSELTILYNHGNAEDLGILEEYLELFPKKGFSIFAYDYIGYGLSSGKPSVKKTYASADMAYEYLTNTFNIPPENIVIFGQSVGGGPATYLAEKHAVGGLVLESAFVSAYRALTVVPIFPFDKFNNVSRIDAIDCPLLIIHGTDDVTIDDWNGRALYNKALSPKTFVSLKGAHHNMMPYDAEEVYWSSLEKFMKSLQ